MRTPAALVLALLVAAVAACSSGGSASPSTDPVPVTLAGTSWKAVSVGGRSTVVDRPPTLTFEATKVSGSGGRNQFGGDYSYADGRITFGQLPMTLMGCDEPIGSIESDFLKVLGGGVTVSMDDAGQLLVEGPGGQALLVPLLR
jgi:heat shock protein HslJ